jgi:2-polyprenyl-3-methyl-5-hydroxy-6-metoxy-1,4-benzoquinol methylase
METWQDISPQPNRPEVIRWRRRRLAAARRPIARDRVAYLEGLARGKRVLDVGVVDHETSRADQPAWLHGRLAEAAAYCLGVDILREEIERLCEAGYHVCCRDVTAEPLDETFDLIVCGELIEHLSRPADLLTAARRMLAPGGRLVLTTPNPHFIGDVLLHWFGRPMDNVDHVLGMFPSACAELAQREGMRLASWRGAMLSSATWRQRLIFRSRHVLGLLGIRREAFCTTLLYELVEAAEA